LDSNPIDLVGLFDLGEATFRGRFRRTPLWRAKRRGLLRNAAIVLGNRPTPEAVPALTRGLNDDEPLVRGASAWALGRHSYAASQEALRRREKIETEAEVISEIEAALSALTG
jgi:epoxyqueuosine reductase